MTVTQTIQPAGSNGMATDRAKRLDLEHRRNELLQLVGSLVDDATALLAQPKVRECRRFRDDLQTIHDRAASLAARVREVIGPDAAGRLAEEAARTLNHDLRGDLTVIIGYADDLHRVAPKFFMDGFQPRLDDLRRHGRRCTGLVDQAVALLRGGAEISGQMRVIAEEIAAAPEPPAPEPGRMLVVDDDDAARDVLVRLLDGRGHHVNAFANPLTALADLGDQLPDVVLLDVVMPGANGLDVLRAFKGNPRLRDIPVIMVSGLGDLDCVIQCIQAGAEDYVAKPYDRTLLLAHVEACLEKKRLRDREAEYLRKIEKQRKWSDYLLNVILPRPIAVELKRTGRVAPRRHDDVAVLFADVAGFTKWSDSHPPEQVVERLQALVESWEDAAHNNRMLKIKTIGDAFMATAGLLRVVDDPVLACVRCGLAMAEATARIAPDWKLRVGVHVGPVVAGTLGKKRFSFDLWGDTVNTASRVESNGVPGAVCLSETAWKRVAERCGPGQPIEREEVKGKGRMTLYRVDAIA